jgi:mannose-1-phosphate guanylyltransferase
MNRDALLTLGIKPDRPETGYGYIQISNGEVAGTSEYLSKVKTFTEKPDYELAKVFYESGDFFWNSGIFIWSLNSIMNSFDKYLSEVNSIFREGINFFNTDKENEFILKTYSKCNNISIDYGIMEKADNVYVLCSDFGWSDLGTWGSLYEKLEKDKNKNTITGNTVFDYDVKGSIIRVPEDKLVVLQGLEDYIVIDTDDILLVCKKGDEQKIKQFVNDVKLSKGDEYI